MAPPFESSYIVPALTVHDGTLLYPRWVSKKIDFWSNCSDVHLPRPISDHTWNSSIPRLSLVVLIIIPIGPIANHYWPMLTIVRSHTLLSIMRHYDTLNHYQQILTQLITHYWTLSLIFFHIQSSIIIDHCSPAPQPSRIAKKPVASCPSQPQVLVNLERWKAAKGLDEMH